MPLTIPLNHYTMEIDSIFDSYKPTILKLTLPNDYEIIWFNFDSHDTDSYIRFDSDSVFDIIITTESVMTQYDSMLIHKTTMLQYEYHSLLYLYYNFIYFLL